MIKESGPKYTGGELEQFIEHRLVGKGYTLIPQKKFKPSTYIGQPIYSKQFFIGKSIYGTSMYCDFILCHFSKYPDCLIIEVKWQQVGGSVDEKYPYLILNIQQRYPHKTVLVLDGGGYKKQAENWIRNQVGNNLLHVFNMQEFQTWVNKGNI